MQNNAYGLKEVKYMNFFSNKVRRTISTIIILLLVLAMIIPTIFAAIS